jgi:hypothetical protein
MKFINIIDVPIFIKSYIFDDKSGTIENFTHIFCKYIMSIEFIEFTNEQKEICYKYIIKDSMVRDYIIFYLDKSKLDFYFQCKYENEKDIPKSLANELFTVELENNNIVKLYIESFDHNIITFSIYK